MKFLVKLDLLFIIILLSIMNVPLLTGATPIVWDTFKIPYQLFYTTYNSVLYHGQIPLWLPYSYYGIPNYFWLSVLSIVNFLFIGIGKLFQIHNVLFLFKASLFGEQLISVFGMYLLGGQIFQKRTTVILTCLAFMTTFSVYRQIALSFRLVYLLPFILFWIVLYFRRKSPIFLWLAAITLIFSVPGSSFYPLVIVFYSIAIFSLILLFSNIKTGIVLFNFSWRNLATFGSLLIISLVFLYYFKTFGDGIGLMREGRSGSLIVPIDIFISNFKAFNPLAMAGSFLYGVIPYDFSNAYEYIFYIGLPLIVGVIAAVLYQRKTYWFATLAAGVFLYAISLRGYFSLAAYFLPYVDITRYISVLGMVPFRTFLILVGGLGLDMDLSLAQWKKIGFTLLAFFLALDIFGLATSPHNPDSETGYIEILMNPASYSMDFKFFLIRIAGYLLLILLVVFASHLNGKFSNKKYPIQKLINVGLLIFIVVDLGLYRYNYEQKIQIFLDRSREQVQFLPALQPMVFQEKRLVEPEDERTIKSEKSTTLLQSIDGYSVNGWVMESFLQFDRCIPDAVNRSKKFEIFTSSLKPLVENNLVLTSMESAPLGLKQIYGCEFPKLRVVSNVVVSPTNEDAIMEIHKTADFSNLLILSKELSQEKSDLNNPSPIVDIQVVSFSPDNIKLNVGLQQENGWLVYSDLYHPDWQVTVNGETKNIEQAYLAFKAIKLTEGTNSVIFNFGSPLKNFGYLTLSILCGAAALVFLISFLAVLFFDF